MNSMPAMGCFKFKRGISKNIDKFEYEVTIAQKQIGKVDGMEKYNEERTQVVNKFTIKEGETSFIEDLPGFRKAMDALDKRYKTSLDKVKANDEKWEKMLDEVIDVEVFEIPEKLVPEEMRPAYIRSFYKMVTD